MEDGSQLDNPFPKEGVVIRGELKDKIIVSVPIDMTHSSVQDLLTAAPKEWLSKLIITTHNVKFMRVKEVKKGEVTLSRLGGE